MPIKWEKKKKFLFIFWEKKSVIEEDVNIM